jgi:hypothetical protein
MHFWHCIVLGFGRTHLGMSNTFRVGSVTNLIKGDFLGPDILSMLNSAIGECVPHEFEFAKYLSQHLQHEIDVLRFSGDLESTNMFGHHTNKTPIFTQKQNSGPTLLGPCCIYPLRLRLSSERMLSAHRQVLFLARRNVESLSSD